MVNADDPIHEQRRLRDARATRSVVAGVAFQGSYVLAQFVILAVLYRQVGPERFGMWVTIFGLTMWVNLLPLGMYQAVLTWLGRVSKHQPQLVWRVLEAAGGVVLLATAAGLLLLVLVGGVVPWADVLNVHDEAARRQAQPTALAAFAVATLALLPVLGGMVLQAYQRGATRHLMGVAGQMVGVVLLLLGVWRDWSLPVLGAVIVSPVLGSGLLQWLAAWRVLPPRPPRHLHPQRLVGAMLETGMGLWLIQLAQVLIIYSGPLLVAQSGEGAQAVAPYAAVYRLIGPLIVMFMVVSQAYWPAYGEAAEASDHGWIARGLGRSAGISVGLWVLGAVLCLLVGRPFVTWWLGPAARPDMGLLLCGLLYALVQGWYYWTTSVLSGLGHVRAQTLASLVALGSYGLSAWMLAGDLGAAGIFLLQSGAVCLIALVSTWSLRRVIMSQRVAGVRRGRTRRVSQNDVAPTDRPIV